MAKATARDQIFADALDLFDALDTKLLNTHNLARVYADMTGTRPKGVLQVDAVAIGGTMGFFADELATARESLAYMCRLVADLHRTA